METTKKVFLAVGLAVFVALIGYFIKGKYGSIMGFILTLLVIGLFYLWRKSAE